MNIEVIRYRLPVYWAHALINDDYTGLLDNEERYRINMYKYQIVIIYNKNYELNR